MRKSFLLTIALAMTAYLALPLPGLSRSLGERIQDKREAIEQQRAKEAPLTTELTSYRVRIQSLQGDISGLQQRQDRVQVELDRKQAELDSIRARLEVVQDRLTKLRARLAEGRELLAERLVALYKEQQPDMVTVVLEARGFTDLLDRAEYIDRISDHNEAIVTRVRDLAREVAVQEKRLSGLEAEAEAATNEVLAKRNQIAGAKQQLVARRDELDAARDKRQSALDQIQAVRHEHEGDLRQLEERQAAIQARLSGTSGTVSGGPIRRGSGNFIWPVNGAVVSGFGPRWGRMHNGVDIAAGAGTPIRAAASGSVALVQGEGASGGYGNFICIQHSGAISTCYAHLSSFGVTGGSVSQGQVIGSVGCTGHCFGDHLHFEVRVNGGAVDPMGYL
jgi:murein DD-endopeptidase MepM/ murein hydrolase activator NlpD